MVNPLVQFERELADLRGRLGRHVLAPDFTGTDISVNGQGLPETIAIDGVEVEHKLFARLFLLPNHARCEVEIEKEKTVDEAPPGIYVKSRHAWLEHYNRVGLYRLAADTEESGGKGVFIDHVFYDKLKAPEQVGTFSFAQLAVAAYELGYGEITLLAGGGAGANAEEWNPTDMVGYMVWPKFGFDAPLEAGETSGIRHLSKCKTVSDVRKADLDWWENKGGNGRVMRFDLRPDSESWRTLLNYIKGKKEFA